MAITSLRTAFDIEALVKQFFGHVPAFVPQLPDQPESGTQSRIASITQKDTNLYGEPLYGQADTMGQEVFCPITIEVDGVDYPFPYVVIGIERSKSVVYTPMTELNGSIKEIIGNQDFIIDIKGFVIGEFNQFPDDQLKVLNDVFEHNQTVRLKSAFSDIFLHGNDTVLITKLSVPQKPKVVGVRDFGLQMMSDGIFNLYQS